MKSITSDALICQIRAVVALAVRDAPIDQLTALRQSLIDRQHRIEAATVRRTAVEPF